MTLLHAHGVKQLQHEFHSDFYARLEARFRDLNWTRGSSGDISPARYHKLQCGYLLCAAAEYASQLRKAKPLLDEINDRIVALLTLGGLTAGPAAASSGLNVAQALQQLKILVRPRSRTPNELYRELFAIQRLASVSLALKLYGRVLETDPNLAARANEVIELSKPLALSVFDQAASVLDQFNDDESINPPSTFWENFLATTSRGPSKFTDYYYLYGCLDVLSQMCGEFELPDSISTILTSMATEKTEPTFRWKALACLYLSSKKTWQDKSAALSNQTVSYFKNRTRRECVHIQEVLAGEDIKYPIAPGQTNDPDELHTKDVLNVEEWQHDEFDRPSINSNSVVLSLDASRFRRLQYLCTGLSPSCRHLFLLTRRELFLSKLNLPDFAPIRSIASLNNNEEHYMHAAISDKLVAVLTQRRIEIIYYENDHFQPVTKNFERSPDHLPWQPRYIAIHDASDHRSFVALAGQYSEQSVQTASINVYEIHVHGSGLQTRIESLSFDQVTPDFLENDIIKSISIDPDGARLACITKRNRILVYFLSNNFRSRRVPFEISREYGVVGPINLSP